MKLLMTCTVLSVERMPPGMGFTAFYFQTVTDLNAWDDEFFFKS